MKKKKERKKKKKKEKKLQIGKKYIKFMVGMIRKVIIIKGNQKKGKNYQKI